MALKSEIARPYEVVVIMHPDANLEEQKELFRKNRSIIQDQFGGKVHSLETWGKRTLGNPINKARKAIYFHGTFEARPAAIAELERTMRINDKVLRFMHSAIDERMTVAKFMENFKKGLAESANREKEREARVQAKRAAMAASRDS